MAGNAAFLKAEVTLAWLGQFDAVDQPTAVELLKAMKLVSRDRFAEQLQTLLLHRVGKGREPVGLYVERELRHRLGVPFRLFKEKKAKVRRAYGVGPKPIDPTKSFDADVGSEGIIAQLVSELCRQHPKRLFNHPGPDAIRKHHIRRFMLVTDFIGSGKRAERYLQAAWRVRSVRSWWSARQRNGLSFEVIAYAATSKGLSLVEGHPSQPKVSVVTACPTIETAFDDSMRVEIRHICRKYSPIKPSEMSPFGFSDGGVLIAFSHGIPNNAPLLLHKRSHDWEPLFPARVTAASRQDFNAESSSPDAIRARLLAMRQTRLVEAEWVRSARPYVRNLLLVMAALGRPPRTPEALSQKTGLAILEVEAALKEALSHGWIDGQHRLTDAGHAELSQARKTIRPKPLPIEAGSFYYPKWLRAPRRRSS